MRRRLLACAIAAAIACAVPAAAAVSSITQRILGFANEWLGTSYLWGGASKGGIDCSGYAREMYRQCFNVELPRTTRQQIWLGVDVPIDPNNLGKGFEPGDLFFYVDPSGIPNHVVIYAGGGRYTHSAGGRGVVLEGPRALWGRRIVGRRLLVPTGKSGAGEFAPIPAAGPIVPKTIPCPPTVRPKPDEVRKLLSRAIVNSDFGDLGEKDICDWRALANALEARGGAYAKDNARAIAEYTVFLESIDNLKDEIAPSEQKREWR